MEKFSSLLVFISTCINKSNCSCMFGLHKSFDAFNRPFDAFDKSFDEFDKSFDAFDKSFDAFDRSFDACNLIHSHSMNHCICKCRLSSPSLKLLYIYS